MSFLNCKRDTSCKTWYIIHLNEHCYVDTIDGRSYFWRNHRDQSAAWLLIISTNTALPRQVKRLSQTLNQTKTSAISLVNKISLNSARSWMDFKSEITSSATRLQRASARRVGYSPNWQVKIKRNAKKVRWIFTLQDRMRQGKLLRAIKMKLDT